VAGDDARAAARAVDLPEYLADLEVFRTLLRHPTLAAGFNAWLAPLLLKGRLDPRLRELIIMRLGWTTGSVYEWTQHWRIATALGVPEEDLLAVRNWRRYDRFGPAERTVLAATDDVVARGVIGDETWAECERVLTTVEERLELVAVTAGWWMVSSMLRSLRVPLEEGVAPWPPDGVAPGAT
jgi:alkylhydroperoxidase family enzyme